MCFYRCAANLSPYLTNSCPIRPVPLSPPVRYMRPHWGHPELVDTSQAGARGMTSTNKEINMFLPLCSQFISLFDQLLPIRPVPLPSGALHAPTLGASGTGRYKPGRR